MKRISLFFAALAMCFAAQAAVITMTPEAGKKGGLQSKVAKAQPGDTIMMETGEYDEPWSFSFDKEGLVVMAAEGAKPVVLLTDAGGWTSLKVAATTTFNGITFDGTNVTKYLIFINGTDVKKAVFENCEFKNYVKYGISDPWTDKHASGQHIDTVLINNCTFHDGGEAVRLSKYGYDKLHACDYFKMTNSTIYNVKTSEWISIVHVAANTTATKPNTVIIDHITMYNFIGGELGGIQGTDYTDLTFTNSIIANPAAGYRIGYFYKPELAKISNNFYLNVVDKSGATHTDCVWDADPMFVYPNGGNFNLRPGSPALKGATDGGRVGDRRWKEAELVAVKGVELPQETYNLLTTDTLYLEANVLPVEATNLNVTWAIANPALATLKGNMLIGLKPGETTITVTTEEGGFKASAKLVVEKKIFHAEVDKADELYSNAADYTVPSYVQFLVAKENARRDSSETNIEALKAKIALLKSYKSPYDVVANINGDPTSRMAFAWFTNENMKDGVVQLVAKADATEADFANAITVNATVETTDEWPYLVDDSGIWWRAKLEKDITHKYASHKAIAEGLTPNTTYTYRVGVDGFWSEMGTFMTAPAATDSKEFSFLYMSDSHILSQEYVDNTVLASKAAIKKAPDAKFCAFAGDFVDNYCSSEWEWERLFEEALRPVADAMPIVPTDGNHDVTYGVNFAYHFNTDNAFREKTQKDPAIEAALDATTYSFMYGDVLFLVFSMQDFWKGAYSYEDLTSIYLTNHVGNWFKSQVAAHPEAKLRIALCHYNFFSGSSHQDDDMGPLLRATLLPVIKECEIDFVIQGHDHCYEVMGPVDPDTYKPILEDIADREAVSTSESMSGFKGGTYTVDRGSMYFIGATCGRKRYWPYTKEEMEADIDKHKVENYFDLFTGMFAQPNKPSYSVFTIKDQTITVESYVAEEDGTSGEPFNTFVVKRTKAHTPLEYIEPEPEPEEPKEDAVENIIALSGNTVAKVIYKGQIFIVKDNVVYNVLGQRL